MALVGRFAQSIVHDFRNPLSNISFAAALASAAADRGPALIRARGETLNGRRVEIEFVLAPLFSRRGAPAKFLGLCQTMSPEDSLGGRPLRRLQAVAVYPPAPDFHPGVRIVRAR